MPYHDWSDENVDWQGIEEAGEFIGEWLIRWVRMPVTQIKEKFGSLRIYCHFGWSTLYSIWRPHYMWIPTWWPYKIDLWLSYNTPFMKWLNKIIIPIHKKAYAWRYKKAVEKWPHLREEILAYADWGQLFEGVVPGYKHSDYWTEAK